MAVDWAQIAFVVGPLIPNGHAVFFQIADVGIAVEKPQKLVNDRTQMQLLSGQQRKACAQIKAHLMAEDGARAGAGAVGFLYAVFKHVTHQREVNGIGRIGW